MTAAARARTRESPAAPGAQTIGSRGRAEVRRSIIRAALELFASDGFEATTVRMIARRCGVTDGLLYYYFPSKRHILDAIWDIPEARTLREVEPARPLTMERLMHLVDEMLSASIALDPVIRLMIRRALSGDEGARAFRQRTMAAWRRDVQAHFATVLPVEEAELNTDLVTSIVLGATFPAMAEAGAGYTAMARTEEFQHSIRDMVIAALPFCRDRHER